jgi:hypothetical protein
VPASLETVRLSPGLRVSSLGLNEKPASRRPRPRPSSYRFKVDLSVVQTTDWEQTVRHPAPGDGYCGDRDVHYVYTGEGDGELKARIRGGRVTFRAPAVPSSRASSGCPAR